METLPKPNLKNYSFEMFSKAGDDACKRLVSQVIKKIDGKYRITKESLTDMIKTKISKLSKLHPEIGDSEPGYHIQEIVNQRLEQIGYSFRVDRYDF